MKTIVDGYNLIFSFGWHTNSKHSMALERARDRLIQELADRIEMDQRREITIVFDAKTTPISEAQDKLSTNGFQVVFARGHDEADSLIEEMIRSHSAPKSLQVVSDDHRLQNCAKRKKAIPIKCEQWLDQLEARQDQRVVSDLDSMEQEIDSKNTRELESIDWMKEFSMDEESNSESNKDSHPKLQQKKSFNPFPPGYGEDIS
jgi:predicted RNA-binding protein with PIN domain